VIQSLTFNKLRSADGSLMFSPAVYDSLGNVTQDGKLQAAFIQADQLSVDYAKMTNISVTSADIATAAITNAKIANASISNAKIGDAQITTAKIGTAQVDTLQIKGQAITANIYKRREYLVNYGNGWNNYDSFYYWNPDPNNLIPLICFFSSSATPTNGPGYFRFQVTNISSGAVIYVDAAPPGPGWFSFNISPGDNLIRVQVSGDGGIQMRSTTLLLFGAAR